jgi:hypothetical protein
MNFNQSILGQASQDFIFIADPTKIFDEGKYSVGISRFNNGLVFADGDPLGQITLRLPAGLMDKRLQFQLEILECVDSLGTPLALNPDLDFLIIGNPTTSIQEAEISALLGLEVFPSSTDKNVFVKFTVKTPQNLSVKLFDMEGRLVRVLSENQLFGSGTHTLERDISGLAKGVYMVQLSSKSEVFSQKIIIN